MERPTDASPTDGVQPAAKPRRPWRAPELTVVLMRTATRSAGTTGADLFVDSRSS